MEAVKHNLISHHNFHPTEDPNKLVNHSEPAGAHADAKESLLANGYEHVQSIAYRDKVSPSHHVYRNKDHGGWAVVTQPKIEGHKTTIKFKEARGKKPLPKVIASLHRAMYPYHQEPRINPGQKHTEHKQHFLEHPDVKKFGGKEHSTSQPHAMTHLKNGDFSLHHSHSDGKHHVTFHHQLPNGHARVGKGSHHNLGVALVHATKDLASNPHHR
jgi:hypothetical protein